MKTFLTILLITFTACEGAHRDTPDTSDARAPGPSCGGDVCDDEPAATCVDGDTLRTYSTTCSDDSCSYPSTDTECGTLGCCDDHCCGVTPSNAIEIGSLAQTGLEVEALSGTFDTSADCVESSVLGECSVVARQTLGEVCVCRSDRTRIGDLRVVGERALVLLAYRDVLVTGVLDLAARKNMDGPGASYSALATMAGAPGGSYGTRGGRSAVPAHDVVGSQTLIPLAGGMGGTSASSGLGGGGGGAIQITAGLRIDIVGTIDVGGGGGGGGGNTPGTFHGGGGGSGGGILLEAPAVLVGGRLLANGGGGGGGGGGTSRGASGAKGGNGWDAAEVRAQPVPITEAPRGGSAGYHWCTGPNISAAAGGAGATGSMPGQDTNGPSTQFCSGEPSSVPIGGGGGGGGVGRIRVNSLAECACSGTISPAATVGTVLTR